LGGEGNAVYVGLPLLVILFALLLGMRRRRLVIVLVGTMAVAAVLSLGPTFYVRGITLPLPWSLLRHLPLIRLAVPPRLFMFGYLAAAVCVAMWLSEADHRWLRVLVAGVALLSLAPDVTSITWSEAQPLPRFFSSGSYQRVLHRNEIVAVVAPGRGPQMYWQEETGMYIRLVGGFVGVMPIDYGDGRIGAELRAGSVPPSDVSLLERFLTARGVEAVIVFGGPWSVDSELEALASRTIFVGDLVVYELGPSPPPRPHPSLRRLSVTGGTRMSRGAIRRAGEDRRSDPRRT
jgi:hypothetical protein